jgi:alcohol dehydrogenase class IV
VSVSDCLDRRGTKYVQDTIANIAKLFGEDDASGAARAYNKLMDAIGLSRDFRSLGIRSRADLETIIMHGFNPQRVNNNPRRLTESALRNILVELQVEA